MTLHRRQFLRASAAFLGVGTAAVAYSQGSRSTLQSSKLITSPSHPAPTGFYAPQRGDVRIAVISDLNSSYGSTQYRAEVEKGIRLLPQWQPDLVLCGGDMVAGQSLKLNQQQIHTMWSAFDRKILSPVRQANLPFAFTLGNHDASSYQRQGKFVFDQDRQAADSFWQKQQNKLGLTFIDPTGFPFYYSFQQHDIFYLVWDASSAKLSNQQLAWAEESLASEAAQSAKLRIVLGHLPFYAVAKGRDRTGEFLDHADDVRARLEKYNVHTYICGHHHAYFPGRVGQIEMLHAGALGDGPRPWLRSQQPTRHTLTLIDVALLTGATAYTTYDMKTEQVLNISQLPRLIVGPNGRERRRDLSVQDLTPEEQQQQYSKSS